MSICTSKRYLVGVLGYLEETLTCLELEKNKVAKLSFRTDVSSTILYRYKTRSVYLQQVMKPIKLNIQGHNYERAITLKRFVVQNEAVLTTYRQYKHSPKIS